MWLSYTCRRGGGVSQHASRLRRLTNAPLHLSAFRIYLLGVKLRGKRKSQSRSLRMRVRFCGVLGMSFAILLGLILAFTAVAADKAPKPAKMANLQGKVQMM